MSLTSLISINMGHLMRTVIGLQTLLYALKAAVYGVVLLKKDKTK